MEIMFTLFDIINEFILSIYSGHNVLNTRKINSNIEKLRKYEWFEELYHNQKYHRLFHINRKIRSHLQSNS
ncbi:hypothetical protein M3182_24595 [Mesobacillus maritimus]|nr:hypothetical protein [Mesobacillus maritimus]MCM3588808.1 hypothetical protein [Mesobacillus maritimus]